MEINSEQLPGYTANAAKPTKQAGAPSDTHVSEQAQTQKPTIYRSRWRSRPKND